MAPRSLAGALAAVVFAAGCSSGGSTDGGGGGTANFIATIDGASWASVTTSTSAHGYAGGQYTIIGSTLGANQLSMSITLYNVGAPGTYPLGVGGLVFGGTASLITATGGS